MVAHDCGEHRHTGIQRAREFAHETHRARETLRQTVIDGADLPAPDQRELLKAASVVGVAGAPQRLITQMRRNRLPLSGLASFSTSMATRSIKMQMGLAHEARLAPKHAGYRFAMLTRTAIPIQYVPTPVPSKDVPWRPGSVVKPSNMSGAMGVFLVLADGKIRSPETGEEREGESSLREAIAITEDRAGRPLKWIVEELITEDRDSVEPARDLKFYAFYGKVGLTLEVVRFPETLYRWWEEPGHPVDTGKYSDLRLENAVGPSAADITEVERISASIPVPFLRIDMLRGRNGPVCNEFTCYPGDYDQFNQRTDRHLGDLFVSAEARLTDDLIYGKRFAEFEEAFPRRTE